MEGRSWISGPERCPELDLPLNPGISGKDPSCSWMIASPLEQRPAFAMSLVSLGNHVDGLIWVSAGG